MMQVSASRSVIYWKKSSARSKPRFRVGGDGIAERSKIRFGAERCRDAGYGRLSALSSGKKRLPGPPRRVDDCLQLRQGSHYQTELPRGITGRHFQEACQSRCAQKTVAATMPASSRHSNDLAILNQTRERAWRK